MEAWVLSNYDRLSVFTKRPSHRDSSSRILLDSDLYPRPESSPVPEPPSGVVLLSAAACALGYTIGELTSKGRATNSLPWYRRFLLTSAFCGACLAIGVEFTAFCLRWVDEREQNAYAESMLRYEVIGGGFFGGLAPLRVGRQTNLSTVNANVGAVSGASRNYQPIFATGVIAMVLSFGIAAHTAWNHNMPRTDDSGKVAGQSNGCGDSDRWSTRSGAFAVVKVTTVMPGQMPATDEPNQVQSRIRMTTTESPQMPTMEA